MYTVSVCKTTQPRVPHVSNARDKKIRVFIYVYVLYWTFWTDEGTTGNLFYSIFCLLPPLQLLPLPFLSFSVSDAVAVIVSAFIFESQCYNVA